MKNIFLIVLNINLVFGQLFNVVLGSYVIFYTLHQNMFIKLQFFHQSQTNQFYYKNILQFLCFNMLIQQKLLLVDVTDAFKVINYYIRKIPSFQIWLFSIRQYER